VTEIEIGRAKRGRRAYSFDDIAIVPSRRTRDPEEVSTAWQIDAYRFDIPVLAAPMDSVMSPSTAIALGQMGGLGVLNLEGLWTRYDDPTELLEEVAGLQGPEATRRMQEIYTEPIKPELITARLKEVRAAGVTVAGSLSPQRTKDHAKAVVDAGVDMFVIRGTTVSAEHVSSQAEPLNLKEFIYELDVPVIVGGCATYQAALPTPPAPSSASRSRWPAPSPTSPPPAGTTSTSPAAATSTSSPTARSAAPATSPRRSPAAPTR
jgi:IMP dehydrogenase